MKKILAFVALALIVTAGGAVTLTDEEQEKCEAGGGCIQATMAQIKEMTERVYLLGRKHGQISCGNRT